MSDFGMRCELVCWNCRVASVEGTFASTEFNKRLREKAIKAGWIVTEYETLCPRCAELRKKKESKGQDMANQMKNIVICPKCGVIDKYDKEIKKLNERLKDKKVEGV